MEQTIIHQPELKCCANCKHFFDGYDGCHECDINRDVFRRTHGKSIDATDICEHFDLYVTGDE